MGANAPYYVNNKVDDVDYIEAADLEAIEAGFSGVDADKSNKLIPANVGNLAALDATGDLADSGKAAPAGAIVGTTDTQTLTNKTLTTPVLSGTASGTAAGRLGYNAGALSFGDGSSQRTVATLNGAQALTNKTLTTPVLSGTASGTTAGRLGYNSGALSFGDGSSQRTVATLDGAQTLTNKTLTSPTLTSPTLTTPTLTSPTASAPVLTSTREVAVAVGGNNLDLSLGNYFTKTVASTTTFTLSNLPPSGQVYGFILDVIDGGDYTVNFWANISWPHGLVPLLTPSGRDVLGFITVDGGASWDGFRIGEDMS